MVAPVATALTGAALTEGPLGLLGFGVPVDPTVLPPVTGTGGVVVPGGGVDGVETEFLDPRDETAGNSTTGVGATVPASLPTDEPARDGRLLVLEPVNPFWFIIEPRSSDSNGNAAGCGGGGFEEAEVAEGATAGEVVVVVGLMVSTGWYKRAINSVASIKRTNTISKGSNSVGTTAGSAERMPAGPGAEEPAELGTSLKLVLRLTTESMLRKLAPANSPLTEWSEGSVNAAVDCPATEEPEVAKDGDVTAAPDVLPRKAM